MRAAAIRIENARIHPPRRRIRRGIKECVTEGELGTIHNTRAHLVVTRDDRIIATVRTGIRFAARGGAHQPLWPPPGAGPPGHHRGSDPVISQMVCLKHSPENGKAYSAKLNTKNIKLSRNGYAATEGGKE